MVLQANGIMLVEQSAPFSYEAEQAVLGAVLCNAAVFKDIAVFLSSEDFFLLRHRHIWLCMARLVDRKEPLDYLTLCAELKATNWLEEIGGQPYITQLVNSTPSSIHGETYGHLVHRTGVRRRLLAAADEIKGLALNEALDIDTVLEQADNQLTAVKDTRHKQQAIETMLDATLAFADEVEYRIHHPGELLGLSTGYTDLDALTDGLQAGDLSVWAGRPSMGKSALGLNVLYNTAQKGNGGALFSMEMNRAQIQARLFGMASGINTRQIQRGVLSLAEYSRFVKFSGELSKLPLFFDYSSGISAGDIRAKSLQIHRKTPLKLIVIDGLWLMGNDEKYDNDRLSTTEQIGKICHALKSMARDLNLHVMLIHQLNRGVEDRQDKHPLLSDLRSSGEIEQDADLVGMLYRDGYYNPATEFPNVCDLSIVKQRTGAIGTVRLHYECTTTRFSNSTMKRVDLNEL